MNNYGKNMCFLGKCMCFLFRETRKIKNQKKKLFKKTPGVSPSQVCNFKGLDLLTRIWFWTGSLDAGFFLAAWRTSCKTERSTIMGCAGSTPAEPIGEEQVSLGMANAPPQEQARGAKPLLKLEGEPHSLHHVHARTHTC